MEYPNDEVVTLLIPFSKKEVLMDFLGARELISVTHDDIYVINELLICLEITVGEQQFLEKKVQEILIGKKTIVT